ncbi:MAG: hypothetical protein CXZ00_03045 [Acidobacteria bacterium]|nr:MAG: hypothetical protein CXZ00_03045 [Acidobacteriota bacterium]
MSYLTLETRRNRLGMPDWNQPFSSWSQPPAVPANPVTPQATPQNQSGSTGKQNTSVSGDKKQNDTSAVSGQTNTASAAQQSGWLMQESLMAGVKNIYIAGGAGLLVLLAMTKRQ